MTKIIPAALACKRPIPPTNVEMPTWREDGTEADPRARLSGVWQCGPLSFHVIALAIHFEDEEGNRVTDPWGSSTVEFDEGVEGYDIAELWTAHGMDGMPESIEIEGREYVVFASPFCR